MTDISIPNEVNTLIFIIKIIIIITIITITMSDTVPAGKQ
jgi:hypothetical protein